MKSSKDSIAERIGYIRSILKETSENDPLYLPPNLDELRSHILRIHIEFEIHMEVMIKVVKMRSGKITKSQAKILESLTFYKKTEIVEKFAPVFPITQARRINNIRNQLVHKKAPDIIDEWANQEKLLSVYEDILDAHEALNEHGSYVAEEMPEWGYPNGVEKD